MKYWFVFAVLIANACEERLDVEHGVVLGMAPSQVRERWSFFCGGRFAGNVSGEDFALDWFAGEKDACVPRGADRSRVLARFEFHGGMLVAMRIATEDRIAAHSENGAWIQVSTEPNGLGASDLHRAEGLRWKIIVLESCPVHQAELRALRVSTSR